MAFPKLFKEKDGENKKGLSARLVGIFKHKKSGDEQENEANAEAREEKKPRKSLSMKIADAFKKSEPAGDEEHSGLARTLSRKVKKAFKKKESNNGEAAEGEASEQKPRRSLSKRFSDATSKLQDAINPADGEDKNPRTSADIHATLSRNIGKFKETFGFEGKGEAAKDEEKGTKDEEGTKDDEEGTVKPRKSLSLKIKESLKEKQSQGSELRRSLSQKMKHAFQRNNSTSAGDDGENTVKPKKSISAKLTEAVQKADSEIIGPSTNEEIRKTLSRNMNKAKKIFTGKDGAEEASESSKDNKIKRFSAGISNLFKKNKSSTDEEQKSTPQEDDNETTQVAEST